jgi:hypothetical protein
MGTITKALFVAGLAGLYLTCGGNPSGKTIAQKYSLPSEIKVVETTLPYEERKVPKYFDKTGIPRETERIVKTANIDFSKDFKIKTERYNLIKAHDWTPLRVIGHINCLPIRLYFFDWDVGWGPDSERTRAALSMLENDKNADGLTVRLNHNKVTEDTYRMFTEKQLTDRNPFLYRATFGLASALFDELWGSLARGDYYNPLTKTVVNYSNVESILAHEIGHKKDFGRFSTDWLYSLSRAFPPVMLYQEWKASTIARDRVLSKDDSNQFYRYLIPAFATYVMAITNRIKKWLVKK